jgi:ribonucleoside-diphosphate reductase beta chain
MKETVFNIEKVDLNKQFMFFGDKPNIARHDIQKHPIFYKLTEKQLGFFWKPEEIDVSKDAKDFKILSDAQKHIFTSTLSYQTLLDSIQARSPALALLPVVSLPELEACIEAWSNMEMIHNLSYSYILRNVYANPSEIFDNITINEDIISRAKQNIQYYDDFLNLAIQYRAGNTVSMKELKEKLLLCIASINILEGLNFYVSFACSFAFAEQGLMEGNAKIISLIARDEALHLAITQNILKKWSNGEDDPEMAKIYDKNLPKIEKMFLEVIETEKGWARYLFKDGSMMGLNEQILGQYVEYIAGKRMKNLGIKHNFPTKNPLSWTDKYLKSSDAQTAPQESEIISYTIGGIKNDLNELNFDEFKF